MCPDLTIITEKSGICALCWPDYVRGFEGYHPCTGPECMRLFLERRQLKDRESELTMLHMGERLCPQLTTIGQWGLPTSQPVRDGPVWDVPDPKQMSQPSQLTLPSPAGWVIPTIQPKPEESVWGVPDPVGPLTAPLCPPPRCPPPLSAPTSKGCPGLPAESTKASSADHPWLAQTGMLPWSAKLSIASELSEEKPSTQSVDMEGTRPAQPSTAWVYTPADANDDHAAPTSGNTQGLCWQDVVHTIFDRLNRIEEKVNQLGYDVHSVNEQLVTIKVQGKCVKE